VPRGAWFWLCAIACGAGLPFVFRDDYFIGVCVLFGIYVAINLMWTLVLGTAGLVSFATLAIVGSSVYFAGYFVVKEGWPWPALLAISTGAGAAAGLIVALPAIRLRGVYFALFTIGLAELARAYVEQNRDLGGPQGLVGIPSFISLSDFGTRTGSLIGYYSALSLVLLALAVFGLVDRSRLGLLLRTARDSEPVASALGIDFVRARFAVFLISSAMLGLIGGYYGSYYGSVAPGIFSFDTLLLLLAMMVVGGIGSARGVLVGTGLLLFIDQHYLETGPTRLIAIGVLMLLVTLFADQGLVGLPAQVRDQLRVQRLRRTASRSGEAGQPIPGGSSMCRSATTD
jgi:branched-chain amino acid transport system permease protein